MPSLVNVIMGPQRKPLSVRPRSVIPGRQRWDIGGVLGRARVAELLEAGLRDSPGIVMVRANPVTGRLLVCHDTALSSTEIDRLVRETIALVVSAPDGPQAAMALAGSSGPEPGMLPARDGRRRHTDPSLVAAGSAAAALMVLGKPSSRPSTALRLGAILVATAAVFRRAWRRSNSSRQSSAVPHRPIRKPLLHIVGSHKKKFYLASSFSILGQLLDIIPYLFIGWIYLVLTTGESAALVSLGLASVASQIVFLASAMALTCVVAAAVSFRSGVLWRDLARSVQSEWGARTYAHVQRVRLQHLEGERTTRLAKILTDDINQLGRFFATSASALLQLGTSFLVIVSAFLIYAPGIIWVILLPVPIIAWMSFSHQERAVRDHAISGEHGALLSSQMINNLEASATVKSFGTEEYEINRIHALRDAYHGSGRQIDKRATAYAQTVRACVLVSLSAIFLLGGLDVLAGTLSFGVFTVLVRLPYVLLGQLPVLGNAVDQYHQTSAALNRVLDILRLPVESGHTGRHLAVETVQGEIVLDGVTFSYPGDSPVLHNLSLRIAARKTTAIVGVTGAGKTTIAKLLLRLEDVDSGSVLLDGVDIRDVRLQDLRKSIGFVAQDAFLFDGPVRDNIRYGSFDADFERVVSAARMAEADGFVQALPLQYDRIVGERGVALSGGQRQRISLARAIVKDSPIVILDEATSAVDNETEAAIQRALADFARDRTLVIIAHRLSTIRHADWIYVLGQGGVLVEAGTHHDLLAREGVYASLWRLQVGEVTA